MIILSNLLNANWYQALEQGVQRFPISASEHGDSVVVVCCSSDASDAGEVAHRNVAAVIDQGVDVLHVLAVEFDSSG